MNTVDICSDKECIDTTNSSTEDSKNDAKNSWSGYHVKFRDPRNFQHFAIDQKFNRWGDMVEFFKAQEKPYKLSQGSLKDLLYCTYKRKGMHSLSLNDLVSITKIERDKISKCKSSKSNDDITANTDSVINTDSAINTDETVQIPNTVQPIKKISLYFNKETAVDMGAIMPMGIIRNSD